MRRALLCLLAVSSAASGAEPAITLAAPSLSYSNLGKAAGDAYVDAYARALSPLGIRVVTANEVAALLGQERQRQMLGCPESEATACVLELAGALGVDGTVTGSLGRFGEAFQLNLVVLSAKDASILSSYAGRADSEEALLELMEVAARATAGEIGKKLGKPARAWRLNTLTVSPSGLLFRRVAVAYERVLSPRFSLLFEPEFLYAEDVAIAGGTVRGTALSLTAGLRWYFAAEAPEGFHLQARLGLYTGYLANESLSAGLLGLQPGVELGYSWVFFSRLNLTLGLGVQALALRLAVGQNDLVAASVLPTARTAIGLAF